MSASGAWVAKILVAGILNGVGTLFVVLMAISVRRDGPWPGVFFLAIMAAGEALIALLTLLAFGVVTR